MEGEVTNAGSGRGRDIRRLRGREGARGSVEAIRVNSIQAEIGYQQKAVVRRKQNVVGRGSRLLDRRLRFRHSAVLAKGQNGYATALTIRHGEPTPFAIEG